MINEGATPTLREVEDRHIAHVLELCGGNISEAARRLGIYRSTLKRRLRSMARRLPPSADHSGFGS